MFNFEYLRICYIEYTKNNICWTCTLCTICILGRVPRSTYCVSFAKQTQTHDVNMNYDIRSSIYSKWDNLHFSYYSIGTLVITRYSLYYLNWYLSIDTLYGDVSECTYL